MDAGGVVWFLKIVEAGGERGQKEVLVVGLYPGPRPV